MAADLVVVATPMIRASYSGVLKLFLDRLPDAALDGTAVMPLTLAPERSQRPAADLQLRPVLASLGACMPVASFLVDQGELADVAVLADAWADRNAGLVIAAVDEFRRLRRPAGRSYTASDHRPANT